jgi:hypothetical protein
MGSIILEMLKHEESITLDVADIKYDVILDIS